MHICMYIHTYIYIQARVSIDGVVRHTLANLAANDPADACVMVLDQDVMAPGRYIGFM